MPSPTLLSGPWQVAPADVIGLAAGAAIFLIGRQLSWRGTQRLWSICGLIYLIAASALAIKRQHPRRPVEIPSEAQVFGGGLETALGLSFLAAALAAERTGR